ncbi:LysR family transcriptional regulator [Breoghania sp.]|uniref:LysR family transcriptional regulator n=1 Tax=Breoghania sp. TaxID=2065378 RepID=UPI002630AE18|nr:LysR family transcriptional regulator [Breoghania sp.]MDJ0930723.1 LysR family transcriptional regulator [Breoghania sp.]
MNTQITLKQFETLFWISRLGTFERAASRLATSQSAVSKRMQELERASSIEIFDRSQRGARLSSKSEELLAIAEKMLDLHDQIADVRQSDAGRPHLLRLGVTELTAMTELPRLVGTLRDRYPALKITPTVEMSRTLFSALEDDQLDLIIVPGAFRLPEFFSLPLAAVENVWMAKKGLIDTSQARSLRELADYPMLMQETKSGSSILFNKWLQAQGIAVQEAMTSDSMTALLGLLVAGFGVSYLPARCFSYLVDEGLLEVIPTEERLPPVPYAAMYREDRPHSLIHKVAEVAAECAYFDRSYQS